MPMPSYVYLVTIVDRADFHRSCGRKVCKTKRAAENWGMIRAGEMAYAAQVRCQEIIDYDYTVEAVSYLDN